MFFFSFTFFRHNSLERAYFLKAMNDFNQILCILLVLLLHGKNDMQPQIRLCCDFSIISPSFLSLFLPREKEKKKRFFHSIKPIKVSNRSFPPSLPNPITPFPNCFKWPETSCWIKDTQQLNGCRWKLPAENRECIQMCSYYFSRSAGHYELLSN